MKVTCPKCGKVLKVPAEMAGKRGQCPRCSAILLMPSAPPSSPESDQSLSAFDLLGAYTGDLQRAEALPAASHHEPATRQPGGSGQIMKVTCPNCGKMLKTPAAMAGKRGQCPSCKAVFLMLSASLSTPEADQGLSSLDLVGTCTGDPQTAEGSPAANLHEPARGPSDGSQAVIKITCPKCGAVLKAPTEMAGKRGQCPGCGTVLLMPSAPRRTLEGYQGLSELDLGGACTGDPQTAEAAPLANHPESPTRQPGGTRQTMKLTCPKCGKVLNAPAEIAGKRGQCPDCRAVFLMPSGPQHSIEDDLGLSGLDLVGAYTGELPVDETLRAQLVTKGFELPESYDGLLQLLVSIDAGAPITSVDEWAAVRCAAEALLKRGHLEMVALVMKAWACTTYKAELNINRDAVALLEKCGRHGVTALCDVLEYWIVVCPAGLHDRYKFKDNLLFALEALGRLGPAASPSKPLIVRCLAFEQVDPDFQARVRALADRIAWNLDLYAAK